MTFFRKSFAASSAVQSVGAAMNVAYLENLSTTTMIDPNPSTLGKAEIKSMEMLSQGLPGIGRGSDRPACFWWSTLSCWQTRQVLTYSSTSSLIWGQKSPSSSRAKVRRCPGCPAHFVSWHSFRNSFLRLPHFGT